MKTYNVQSILDWLETKNFLKQRPQAEAFILTQGNVDKLPIPIIVLMGIGSLIGLGCVFTVLYLSHIINFNNELELFLGGMISIALALISYYGLRYQTRLLQSFGIQCALILMLVGKLLVVMGFTELAIHVLPMHVNWMISFGLLMVTISLYAVFPVQLDRFLFCLFSLCSILANTIIDYHNNLPLFIFFVALVFFTVLLFVWRNKSHAWGPIAYACAVALCLSALYLSVFNTFQSTSNALIPMYFFNLVLGFALILLTYFFGKNESALPLSTLSACIGIGILTFITNTGILAALALFIIGKAKYERPLTLLGGVFLCLFIIEYYYTLHYPLDLKAGILVATGATLLAARMLIQTMKWDSETP